MLKCLVTNDIKSTEFISLSFPKQNDKWIATLGGDPDYYLVLWQWDRQKVLAAIRVGNQRVHEVSFNPCDMTLLVCLGEKFLTYFT